MEHYGASLFREAESNIVVIEEVKRRHIYKLVGD